jgi:amino acid permease
MGTAIASALIVVPYIRLTLRTFHVSVADFLRDAVIPPYAVSVGLAIGLTLLVSVRPPGSLRETGVYGVGAVLLAYLAFFAVFVGAAERARFLTAFQRVSKTRA